MTNTWTKTRTKTKMSRDKNVGSVGGCRQGFINLDTRWRCSRAPYLTIHPGRVAKYGEVKLYA